MKKAPATGQGLGGSNMNNENELHDVTFKIRYPSKKEKILYAVKSILIDELNILVQSIITAATLCFLAENGWSISQKNNVLIVLLFVVFFISQILMCLRVLTGKYTLKEIIIREVKEWAYLKDWKITIKVRAT